MDLSLREGHDVATVSSCYCSFVHPVLFFVEFIICYLIFLRCEEILGHLSYFILADCCFLFIEKNPLMIALNVYLVSFSASFSLSLSDIPCCGSSTEVFANSKCENQITSHSVFLPPPPLSFSRSPILTESVHITFVHPHTDCGNVWCVSV